MWLSGQAGPRGLVHHGNTFGFDDKAGEGLKQEGGRLPG